MKCLVIDAINHTIREDDYNGNYKDIYRLGGFDLMTTIALDDNGETLFIDDEGLLKEDLNDYFILHGPDFSYPQPLPGNGVILGTDKEGESIATTLTVETLRRNVLFAKLRCAGFTPPSEQEIDHPIFGKTVVLNTGTPIFEPVKDEDDETNMGEPT
jgi:hypothetical protein